MDKKTYEIYNDNNLGVEICYTLFPPDTIYPPEIEMQKIHINGDDINLNLEAHLWETFGENWEKEILKGIQP